MRPAGLPRTPTAELLQSILLLQVASWIQSLGVLVGMSMAAQLVDMSSQTSSWRWNQKCLPVGVLVGMLMAAQVVAHVATQKSMDTVRVWP